MSDKDRTISIIGPHIEDVPSDNPGERTISVLVAGLDDGTTDERTIKDRIEKVLIDDERKGNLSKVAYVIVAIEHFVYLIAESTIRGYHLSRSREEAPFILTIPDVQFGKYKYPVKVASYEVLDKLTRGSMATMTKDNTVA